MKLFKNEFRKTFSIGNYIAYLIIYILNVALLLWQININPSNTYDNLSAIGFTSYVAQATIGIIIIFCIVFTVNTFSIDYTQYTWKNLLCTGVDKFAIEKSKTIFAIVQSFFYLGITYLISFIIGLIQLGFDINEQATNYVGEFNESAIKLLVKCGINNIMSIIFYIAFISLLVEILRGSRHVMLIVIITYFMSNTATMIIQVAITFNSKFEFLKYSPFYYSYPGITAPLRNDMIKSACTLLAYTIIFTVIKIMLFKRRDIKTSK